jgi:hypothetical protein
MTRFMDPFRGVQRSDARTFLAFPKGKGTNAERKYFFHKRVFETADRAISAGIGSKRRRGGRIGMLYLVVKAAISGLVIAAVSVIARRSPGFGALVASLPLVSVLGMIWLWRDKPDAENMAAHAGATFWYVLPSLPMFLLIPALLRGGVNFWVALALGCALTVALYLMMVWAGPRFGLRL